MATATPQTATGFGPIKAASDSPSLVRKALEVITFLAPMTADLPETLTNADGVLLPLPDGWVPAGVITPDGITFGGDVEKSEVEALGYSTPVRTDIIRAPKTISVTFLESYRRFLLELLYGLSLEDVTQGENGEIVFDEPPIPQAQEYRMLTVAADGAGRSAWLDGRGYGRVKVATIPEETWTADDPMQYPIEFDVLLDDQLGTPVRHYIGGPGAKAAADRLGFLQYTPIEPGTDAPTIATISPTSGEETGGEIVTITGTGFAAGTTVKFGDVDASNVTIDSTTTIMATAPAHAVGPVTISVSNTSGTATSPVQYEYTADVP